MWEEVKPILSRGTLAVGVTFLERIGCVKFMLSKKATKIDEIFTIDLTATTYFQIDGQYFVTFCGLLRKREL